MKKWYVSKTMIVNAVSLVIMIAEWLLLNEIYSPELHGIVITGANLLLRIMTRTAITK